MAYWSAEDAAANYRVCRNCTNGRQILPVIGKPVRRRLAVKSAVGCKNHQASGTCK